jgi:hypothetical protein
MGLDMKQKKALTKEVAGRYRKAGLKEKTAILNEFVANTGYDRKYAITMLNRKPAKEVLAVLNGKAVKYKAEKKRRKKREGKRIYGDKTIASLRLIWDFFWNKCGKILAPLMRGQMKYIAEWPAFGVTPEIRRLLMKISPATIDRALKKAKDAMRIKGLSGTKKTKGLKSRIPIRTFYTQEEKKKPGYLHIDTVLLCGASTGGEYLVTLTATDVCTGWVEMRILLNKAWKWVFEALEDIRGSLPFPLLEFHSDNGGECINKAVEKWCIDEGIPFTRNRDRQSNDNCYVEQKNDKCVREYIGYARMTTPGELELVRDVYSSLNPFLDYFMPTAKLREKTRVGSKEKKKYAEPISHYVRLLESATTNDAIKKKLKKQCGLYNPVELQYNINMATDRLEKYVGGGDTK